MSSLIPISMLKQTCRQQCSAGGVTLISGSPAQVSTSPVLVTIPVDGTNATLNDLSSDINAELLLFAGFSVILLPGLTETGSSYQASLILPSPGTSTSANLWPDSSVTLGSDVPSSRNPAQYEFIAGNLSPTTGVLAEDVVAGGQCHGDSADVTVTASVTISRANSLTNAGIGDLVIDINAALIAAGFDIVVRNESGSLVFASDTVDIEITPDSTNADLIGLLDVAAGTSGGLNP